MRYMQKMICFYVSFFYVSFFTFSLFRRGKKTKKIDLNFGHKIKVSRIYMYIYMVLCFFSPCDELHFFNENVKIMCIYIYMVSWCFLPLFLKSIVLSVIFLAQKSEKNVYIYILYVNFTFFISHFYLQDRSKFLCVIV